MGDRRVKVSERMLIVWLTLGGVILLFTPARLVNKLQFGFIRTFCKPLKLCRYVTLSASEDEFSANAVARSKYIRLRNHLANNIQWLRQERQKVEKLSGLRDRAVWRGVNFVAVNVITTFTDGMRNELIINRGEDDGLVKGQFVLDDRSIIGTICELDCRTARVKLITDPNSKIAVKMAGSEAAGIMYGKGNSSAKVQLPIKHKIKIGGAVYARKKGGFLDAPVITATVSEYKRDDENPLLWDITVKPACDMQELKSAAVIIMNP